MERRRILQSHARRWSGNRDCKFDSLQHFHSKAQSRAAWARGGLLVEIPTIHFPLEIYALIAGRSTNLAAIGFVCTSPHLLEPGVSWTRELHASALQPAQILDDQDLPSGNLLQDAANAGRRRRNEAGWPPRPASSDGCGLVALPLPRSHREALAQRFLSSGATLHATAAHPAAERKMAPGPSSAPCRMLSRSRAGSGGQIGTTLGVALDASVQRAFLKRHPYIMRP